MAGKQHRAPFDDSTELRIAKVLADLVRDKYTYVALARAREMRLTHPTEALSYRIYGDVLMRPAE